MSWTSTSRYPHEATVKRSIQVKPDRKMPARGLRLLKQLDDGLAVRAHPVQDANLPVEAIVLGKKVLQVIAITLDTLDVIASLALEVVMVVHRRITMLIPGWFTG